MCLKVFIIISLQLGPFKEHMIASELCSMWDPYLHRPRCFLIEVTQIKKLASMKSDPDVIKMYKHFNKQWQCDHCLWILFDFTTRMGTVPNPTPNPNFHTFLSI